MRGPDRRGSHWLGDDTIALIAAGVLGLFMAALCPRIATGVRKEPTVAAARAVS